jgi:N-terminal acetyltransferase B complex catalytic subunit
MLNHASFSLTVLGKVESSPFPPPVSPYDPATNPDQNYLPWHAHITALTVAPHARRMGLATRLTAELETAGEAADAWFVDLFVRTENRSAIRLYEKLGYSVFRKVVGYYADEADAFDMRKSLKRDVGGKHVREKGETFEVTPSDVW